MLPEVFCFFFLPYCCKWNERYHECGWMIAEFNSRAVHLASGEKYSTRSARRLVTPRAWGVLVQMSPWRKNEAQVVLISVLRPLANRSSSPPSACVFRLGPCWRSAHTSITVPWSEKNMLTPSPLRAHWQFNTHAQYCTAFIQLLARQLLDGVATQRHAMWFRSG